MHAIYSNDRKTVGQKDRGYREREREREREEVKKSDDRMRRDCYVMCPAGFHTSYASTEQQKQEQDEWV